jgi:hypothetical protein
MAKPASAASAAPVSIIYREWFDPIEKQDSCMMYNGTQLAQILIDARDPLIQINHNGAGQLDGIAHRYMIIQTDINEIVKIYCEYNVPLSIERIIAISSKQLNLDIFKTVVGTTLKDRLQRIKDSIRGQKGASSIQMLTKMATLTEDEIWDTQYKTQELIKQAKLNEKNYSLYNWLYLVGNFGITFNFSVSANFLSIMFPDGYTENFELKNYIIEYMKHQTKINIEGIHGPKFQIKFDKKDDNTGKLDKPVYDFLKELGMPNLNEANLTFQLSDVKANKEKQYPFRPQLMKKICDALLDKDRAYFHTKIEENPRKITIKYIESGSCIYIQCVNYANMLKLWEQNTNDPDLIANHIMETGKRVGIVIQNSADSEKKTGRRAGMYFTDKLLESDKTSKIAINIGNGTEELARLLGIPIIKDNTYDPTKTCMFRGAIRFAASDLSLNKTEFVTEMPLDVFEHVKKVSLSDIAPFVAASAAAAAAASPPSTQSLVKSGGAINMVVKKYKLN